MSSKLFDHRRERQLPEKIYLYTIGEGEVFRNEKQVLHDEDE